MSKITMRDFVEALKKNGYTKNTNGNYIDYNENWDVVAACAYGQAWLNLNEKNFFFSASNLHNHVLDFMDKHDEKGINIIFLNDHTETTVPEIGSMVEAAYREYLDEVIWEQK